MRVVHAVRSNAFAGVESHVARLARAQVRRGDDVMVIGGDLDRMRGAIGPGARLLPATHVTEVLGVVRRVAPGADVVHAHMTAAEVAAAAALFGTRKPLVVTRHFARTRGSNPASVLAGALAARRVGEQIAISRWVASRIAGHSVVIHPGVDVVEATVPSESRDGTVLVAQRLEREKETDVAIRAFALSGLAAEGWDLVLAGDGAERRSLEALVKELDLARSTRFLGHRTDVVDLMTRASVLLAPCRVEGLGLTVLEAMAAALPVVAVGAGGHLETVGAVDGARLHDPGDVSSAAGLLRALAADDDARDAYGAALQREQRAHFTPEHQSEATARVYEGLV